MAYRLRNNYSQSHYLEVGSLTILSNNWRNNENILWLYFYNIPTGSQ